MRILAFFSASTLALAILILDVPLASAQSAAVRACQTNCRADYARCMRAHGVKLGTRQPVCDKADADCNVNCTAKADGPPAALCRSGLVWRERFDGDTVCVTPAERDANRRRRGLPVGR